jgi:hypothetical protein
LLLQLSNVPTLQIAGELLDLVGDTAFEIVQDLLLVRGLAIFTLEFILHTVLSCYMRG